MSEKHRNPALTVDGVLIEDGKVLLIRRGREPFRGKWAFPGGFVEYGEKVEDAVIREFREETGIDAEIIDLLGVYSDANRDPRGYTVSIVYLLKKKGGEIRGGDDASEARFFPIDELPEMAFDHGKIVRDAIRTISNIV